MARESKIIRCGIHQARKAFRLGLGRTDWIVVVGKDPNRQATACDCSPDSYSIRGDNWAFYRGRGAIALGDETATGRVFTRDLLALFNGGSAGSAGDDDGRFAGDDADRATGACDIELGPIARGRRDLK